MMQEAARVQAAIRDSKQARETMSCVPLKVPAFLAEAFQQLPSLRQCFAAGAHSDVNAGAVVPMQATYDSGVAAATGHVKGLTLRRRRLCDPIWALLLVPSPRSSCTGNRNGGADAADDGRGGAPPAGGAPVQGLLWLLQPALSAEPSLH